MTMSLNSPITPSQAPLRGSAVSQPLSSCMVPRPQDARTNDISIYPARPGERLAEAVETMGRRWTQIVDEARFSPVTHLWSGECDTRRWGPGAESLVHLLEQEE
jgi:hypothetical protein